MSRFTKLLFIVFACFAGASAAWAGTETPKEPPKAARASATKPLRLDKILRPLALFIARLEYAPRVGRP